MARQGATIGYDAIFAGMAVVSLTMLPRILIVRPARPVGDELVEAHLA